MADRERRYPDEDVMAAIRLASDDTCCICREPRHPVQIHHIDEDRSNADPDNFAVLCANCHLRTVGSPGFARKLDPATVRAYRDEWHSIVRQRRERATQAAQPALNLRETVIRQLRRGRTIAAQLGAWQSLNQREIAEWEAGVAYIFDSKGRTDLTQRFLWDPPLDLPAMFVRGGPFDDAPLRRRMKRRLTALNDILSEL